MTMTQTLKQRLDSAAAEAEEALSMLVSGSLSREQFADIVRRFTLAKFFLTEEECPNDNIFCLAEISIEKLLSQNDKSVTLAQGSNTCTNQSSTDIKKVLLSLTLQRALDIQFTPAESAELETISQLEHALYDAKHPNNDLVD